jgi:hypothetical protein
MEGYQIVLIALAVSILLICWMIFGQLSRLDSKINAILRQQNIDPMIPQPLSERVKEVATDPARKIEAIKIYREETGVGLAEAKNAIEAHLRQIGE